MNNISRAIFRTISKNSSSGCITRATFSTSCINSNSFNNNTTSSTFTSTTSLPSLLSSSTAALTNGGNNNSNIKRTNNRTINSLPFLFECFGMRNSKTTKRERYKTRESY
ncbi:hypothetical protein DFA_10149 [Cavenderia fasciculata]|uniref:Uncharacterized protein n=1 Tax=Cavenderia fasciculata TaxID=261658 RepID=F4Q9E6_CACFS|nr:uncharacterized protein DFA_10149 [Cavenderia fasciculata]EGG15315.1 hypothetical protein DFA_10149 [Cavenderia fasciculata]|eukprot:XP_004352035.1 hypothetical protein DFA_10149 [Cavenderia fasciculata]